MHCCRRSAPDIPPCVTFDESLLEETELLESGELQLNELTVESVQHTCVGAQLGTEGGGRHCPCSAAARLRAYSAWQGGSRGVRLSHCPSSGRRLTSVTDDLAAATQTVLSRQEAVTQLQRELWNEEQTTHPRER